jgi:Arc/MetJ family transcription regulator
VRKTTVAVDEGLAAEAGRLLGTTTLTATVNQAMREVLAAAARRKLVDRLRRMDGLELDNPDVMSVAWR